MVDISLVDGVTNQLITGEVPHCRCGNKPATIFKTRTDLSNWPVKCDSNDRHISNKQIIPQMMAINIISLGKMGTIIMMIDCLEDHPTDHKWLTTMFR